jgi:ketosteroid isomerase-like protein
VNVALHRSLAAAALLLSAACAAESPRASADAVPDANARLDTLSAKLAAAYHARDPVAYARLYTDSGVFEWPAFNTVRGRAALEALGRDNMALDSLAIRITPSSRRIAADHATEFGSFVETWTDSTGARKAEYGRYAQTLARQPDGSWLIDHFFGFEDSTATLGGERR